MHIMEIYLYLYQLLAVLLFDVSALPLKHGHPNFLLRHIGGVCFGILFELNLYTWFNDLDYTFACTSKPKRDIMLELCQFIGLLAKNTHSQEPKNQKKTFCLSCASVRGLLS